MYRSDPDSRETRPLSHVFISHLPPFGRRKNIGKPLGPDVLSCMIHAIRFYKLYDDDRVIILKPTISVQCLQVKEGYWRVTQHLLGVDVTFASGPTWQESRSDLRSMLNDFFLECVDWAGNRRRTYRYMSTLILLSEYERKRWQNHLAK